MKKNLSVIAVLIVGLLCFGVDKGFAHKDGPSPGSEERRARVFQMIMTRLSTGLQLNETQRQQMETLLQKNKEQKKTLYRQKRELLTQLQKEVQAGDDKKIQATLKQWQDTRDQLDRLDNELFKAVKPMLSPRQQAQFVLIMDEIRHEVRGVRHRHGMGPDKPQ